MQPRSLKVRLAKLLQEKYPNTKIAAHAEALGISDTTLRKYLRDEALTLERRVIERACDYLNVGIEELFELVKCDFFPQGNKSVRLLRGKRSGLDDFGTINSLSKFFANNGVSIDEEVCDNLEEIAQLVRDHDCMIVGSPRTNAAGEVAMCTLFQADLSNTSKENRRKLPFVMQVPPEWHVPTALIHALSKQTVRLTQCQLMAVESAVENNEKRSRASADYYTHETFAEISVDRGRDFGVILVADHQSQQPGLPPSRVRTYWVSGFSSVGTQASTVILESDFRSFSIEPGEFILAIVQAYYTKRANSLERKLLQEPKIVHTIRGRLPATAAGLISGVNALEDAEESGESGSAIASTAGAIDSEPNHNARRHKFRVVVQKTWRRNISKEMTVLMQFYDRELYALSDGSFTGTLARLKEGYAGIPQLQFPQPLDAYLRNVIEARDGGLGDLFKDQ